MTESSASPSAPDPALEAVNEGMAALHERYHGRKPGTARTMMMDEDILAVLLGDIYTNVEKAMIELQREAMVQETRSTFQKVNERRFIEIVERLTGRRVAQFLSTHHVGPDLEFEIFLLEPRNLMAKRPTGERSRLMRYLRRAQRQARKRRRRP